MISSYDRSCLSRLRSFVRTPLVGFVFSSSMLDLGEIGSCDSVLVEKRLLCLLPTFSECTKVLQFVSMENLNSRVEFTGFSVFLSLRNLDVCAVSVAILPQADEVDVQLRNEDLRIDTYRSGGCGGQHANTTNSAVRIINPSSNWDHGLHPRRKNTTYEQPVKATWRPIWTNPYVQFSIEDMMEGENLDTFIDALLLHQEMDAIASFSSTS
ncbi:hypothetical protein YC2023_101581 [Brassica napus]